ncbi:MAG: helix-turn-helix transcriptional regulator [Desulfobulbus sp.]|nr:helix-turn-helix transcriptional regulator [Desulfobulbus sp.]
MTEDEQAYLSEIGGRIAKARGEKTQPVFAEELGISKNTLLRYEKGYSVPDVVIIRKICTLSEVSLEWLVNGEQCRSCENASIEKSLEKTCRINHLEDPFITDIKLWLNEMTSDDPGWRVWFKMELLSKIPKFKEWWEKKRGGDAPKQSNAA